MKAEIKGCASAGLCVLLTAAWRWLGGTTSEGVGGSEEAVFVRN